MNPKTLTLAVIGICAGIFAPVLAEAQSFGVASAAPAPLYPHELQPGQSYAVEVAPNTYVIHRQGRAQAFPYIRCVDGCGHPPPHHAQATPAPHRFDRPAHHNDPALIEALRERAIKRNMKKTAHEVVHSKVVRDKPVVIEHRRVVDDPPHVIERHRYVEDAPAPHEAGPKPVASSRKARIAEHNPVALAAKSNAYKDQGRVIHAEAEVTILGPDRMSIRLFRKGGAQANAREIEKH